MVRKKHGYDTRMMPDESPSYDSLLSAISKLIAGLPAGSRREWVAKAIFQTPSFTAMLGGEQRLSQWLVHLETHGAATLADYIRPIAIQDGGVSTCLERFKESLLDLIRSRSECIGISRLLHRWPPNKIMEWQDGLAAAIAENTALLQLAHTNREVISWLRKAMESSVLPSIEGIVPPLSFRDLSTLRKSIDKHRKRTTRERSHVSLEGGLLTAYAVSAPGLEAVVEEEQRRQLEIAFRRLPSIDRHILKLHLEGKTLAEIGEVVDLAKSTVCERLARSIVRVARFVRERGP